MISGYRGFRRNSRKQLRDDRREWYGRYWCHHWRQRWRTILGSSSAGGLKAGMVITDIRVILARVCSMHQSSHQPCLCSVQSFKTDAYDPNACVA